MCIRQELSQAHTASAPLADDSRQLLVEHRGRDVGVLDRERAAEAAALLGVRQLDELEARHRAQQPGRSVADTEQAQRMARRVVRHGARVGRADLLDPEHAREELRQLPGPRRHAAVVAAEQPGKCSRTCAAQEPEGVTIASKPSKTSTKRRASSSASPG